MQPKHGTAQTASRLAVFFSKAAAFRYYDIVLILLALFFIVVAVCGFVYFGYKKGLSGEGFIIAFFFGHFLLAMGIGSVIISYRGFLYIGANILLGIVSVAAFPLVLQVPDWATGLREFEINQKAGKYRTVTLASEPNLEGVSHATFTDAEPLDLPVNADFFQSISPRKGEKYRYIPLISPEANDAPIRILLHCDESECPAVLSALPLRGNLSYIDLKTMKQQDNTPSPVTETGIKPIELFFKIYAIEHEEKIYIIDGEHLRAHSWESLSNRLKKILGGLSAGYALLLIIQISSVTRKPRSA